MEYMPGTYVSALSKVRQWVWLDGFLEDLWRPEPKTLRLYLYSTLFLERLKELGRGILRELWKVGGGDNFEQVGAGGPQQWPCFHHWA